MNKQIEEKILTKNMPAVPSSAIAVLPTKIISNEKADCLEFLNLADPVISNLSRSRQIIVRPTSASRFFDDAYDPADVGFTLGVDYVVDSRVRQTGEQIRATVQLLRVLDGKLLWSEDYENHYKDIALIESSISKQVMRTLNLRADEKSEMSALRRYTNKLELYRKFKSGRASFNESRFKRAINCFKRIIKIDENYVPAVASLADCYLFLGIYNDTSLLEAPSPEALFALAREWANIALEKDSSLAEVRAALGYTHMFDLNWSDAETEFKLAIKLSNNCSTAHQGYAHYLTASRRFVEALAQIEQALEIDPFSPIINLIKGFVLYFSGKYGESLEQFRYTVLLNRRSHAAHYGVALAASMEGESKEALDAVCKAIEYSNNDAQKRALRAYLLAMSGDKAKAREELEELNKERIHSYVSPFQIAAVCAALDEPEQALFHLEEAFEIKDHWLILLRDDPRFVKLHGNSKYTDLIQRLNFPEIEDKEYIQ